MAFTIVEAMRLKHTPTDMTAKIKMNDKLKQLLFKKAEDFHTQVLLVMAKYKIQKNESDCVDLLVKKVQKPMYAKMIIDHLDGSNHDLETICTDIAKIQRLARAMGPKSSTKLDKEVQLASAEGGGKFQGICRNYKKRCGHKRKDSTSGSKIRRRWK